MPKKKKPACNFDSGSPLSTYVDLSTSVPRDIDILWRPKTSTQKSQRERNGYLLHQRRPVLENEENQRRNCHRRCSTTHYLEGRQGIVYLTAVDLIAIVCWKKELSGLPALQARPNAARREGADTMVLHYFASKGYFRHRN